MRTHQLSRLTGRFVSCALTAIIALLALNPGAFAQPAAVGNWRQPVNCQSGSAPDGWPDGSMHLIHVVTRDTPPSGATHGVLVGRLLTYYAPSCPGTTFVPMPSGCGAANPFFPCGQLAQPTAARLYNPADNTNTFLTNPGVAVFPCVGHVHAANRAVLITGGGCTPGSAQAQIIRFWPSSPTSGDWAQLNPMLARRWYPTTVVLSNSLVVNLGGVRNDLPAGAGSGCNEDSPAAGYVYAKVPELYNPRTNQSYLMPPLSTTKCVLAYPFAYMLPRTGSVTHERIFWAGPGLETSILHIPDLDPAAWTANPPNAPYWTNFDPHPQTWLDIYADDGSSVMYAPGKILKCGGYLPAEQLPPQFETCQAYGRTAIIDFNATTPAWVSIDDPPSLGGMNMITRRKHHDLVMTPLGRPVAVGGQQLCSDICAGSGHVCGCTTPVLETEWFDPDLATPRWFPLAEMSIPRVYHSTTALLADGTIIACGGEDWFAGQPGSRSAQVFEPPYLFDQTSTAQPTPYAARPVIIRAAEHMDYASSYNITMSAADVANAGMVSLARVAAVTHGFDQNQRFLTLPITSQSGTTLTVTGPPDGSHAPPGYYMLFVVSRPPDEGLLGTPSIARYVRLGCLSDLNEDCVTDGLDLAALLGDWGPCIEDAGCPSDFNGDGTVNGLDLAILLGKWEVECAQCPPPPGGGGSSATSPGGGGESGGGSGGEAQSAASSGAAEPEGEPGPPSIATFWSWYFSADWQAFLEWAASQPQQQ